MDGIVHSKLTQVDLHNIVRGGIKYGWVDRLAGFREKVIDLGRKIIHQSLFEINITWNLINIIDDDVLIFLIFLWQNQLTENFRKIVLESLEILHNFARHNLIIGKILSEINNLRIHSTSKFLIT